MKKDELIQVKKIQNSYFFKQYIVMEKLSGHSNYAIVVHICKEVATSHQDQQNHRQIRVCFFQGLNPTQCRESPTMSPPRRISLSA